MADFTVLDWLKEVGLSFFLVMLGAVILSLVINQGFGMDYRIFIGFIGAEFLGIGCYSIGYKTQRLVLLGAKEKGE